MHPSASALTVHTAVKFCVSPGFMVACSSRFSRFLYLLLDVLLNICVYLLVLFFLDLMLTISATFMFMENASNG